MKTFTCGELESETINNAIYYRYSSQEGLRRIIGNIELTDEEVLALAVDGGTFDFLYEKGEDIYTINDGEKI